MKDASLAIVQNLNNDLLLVKRGDVPVWVLPGGGIEPGETPEDAAVRETSEETGISVSIKGHLATYLPVNSWSSTTHLFLCRPPTTLSFRLQEEEVIDARFFSLHDLPSTLFPIHRSFIEEWQSVKTFPIIRPLKEASYSSLFHFLLFHPLWSLRYLWTRFRVYSLCK